MLRKTERPRRTIRSGSPLIYSWVALAIAGGVLGCGGGVKNPEATAAQIDRAAPAPAGQLGAALQGASATLTWENPDDPDFAGARLRRSSSGFPENPAAADSPDDRILYEGTGDRFTDAGLSDGAAYYYSLFAFDASRNYGKGIHISINVDLSPPASIDGFQAVQSGGTLLLSWSNPIDPDFSGVRVRRTFNAPSDSATAPQTAGDAIVFEGSGAAFTDGSIEEGNVYVYTAFAYDGALNYSSGVSVSIDPDLTPPGEVANLKIKGDSQSAILTWSNPEDADFMGVVVKRSATATPTSALTASQPDEAVVYEGSGASLADSGLTNGAGHYYSLFTHDARENYSAGTAGRVVPGPASYTVIIQPDSQYYTLGWPYILVTSSNWIVNNKDDRNIAFFIHEGDITHNNSEPEWQNALMIYDILEGQVPYALNVGNHDIGAGRDTGPFNAHFPVSRFQGRESFGGSYPDGKMDNAYYYFSTGDVDWLVVSLMYNPNDDELAWANEVVSAHPDRKVMVVTHAYLWSDNTRTSIGENVWAKFVKLHENILFVFNGHYIDDKEKGTVGRLVSEGDNGNLVYQMLANYQHLPFGGYGLFRIMEMNPAYGTVQVTTYSPNFQLTWDDGGNQFFFEGVDFGL